MTYPSSPASSGSSFSPSASPSGSVHLFPEPASSPTCSDDSRDLVATDELAAELLKLEGLLQQSFACASRLGSRAIDAQAEHKLSIVAGRQILTSISQLQGQIAVAIANSAEAHRLLETLGRKLGLDVSGYGDSSKYPGAGADGSRYREAA